MLLTACVIVQDRVDYIARTINSVKGLADEILVLDIDSYDRSAAVAADCGVRVYSCNDNSFAETRNYILKKAEGDWVLFLHGGEELASDYNQLRLLLKQSDNFGFYLPIISLSLPGRSPENLDLEMPCLVFRLLRNKQGMCFKGEDYGSIIKSICRNTKKMSIKTLQLPIITNCYQYPKFYTSQGLTAVFPYSREISGENFLKKVENREDIVGGIIQEAYKEAAEENNCHLLDKAIYILLNQGKFLRAERVIKQAEEFFPGEFTFALWEGYLRFVLKDYQQAITCLQKLLNKEKDKNINFKLYFLLGLAYKGIRHFKKANYFFGRAHRLDRCNKAVISNLIDLEKKGINKLEGYSYLRERLVSPQGKLLLADIYYHCGDYYTALDILKEALEFKEIKDSYYYWKARILLKTKDYRLALKLLRSISPAFNHFKDTLKHCWILNILLPVDKEFKSIVNQIKLLGDSDWELLKLYNTIYFKGKDFSFHFNNILSKYKFYEKAVAYLSLLIEYCDDRAVEIMLDIIKKLKIRESDRYIGKLFFRYAKWDKAYYYLKKDLSNGFALPELSCFIESCRQLDRSCEEKKCLQILKKMGNYQLIVNKN